MMRINRLIVTAGLMALFTALPALAEEEKENASNPLANVRNTDTRWKYYSLDGSSQRNDMYLDGSYPFASWLKLKYELHYWETDVTGASEHGWESLHLKLISFPTRGKWGDWKYGVALGAEWILDAGNTELGIGSGSDQIAPLVGVSLQPNPKTTLVPLLQQFVSYNGPDVNQTAARLIVIQALPKGCWGKGDLIVPYDWEHDAVPATFEAELGKMFTSAFGAYVDGEFGLGPDRPYDWGVGLGVRFLY